MNENLILAAALRCAKRGWRVFPLKAGEKIPAIKRWPEQATTVPAAIRRWLKHMPQANLAICTGHGLGVLDVDLDKGGYQSLRELRERLGGLPETLTAATGGGGLHLFFDTGELTLHNRTNLLPGLDWRGEGGYVVAPPSVHPNGEVYTWASCFETAPGPLPEGLRALVAKGKPSFDPHPRSVGAQRAAPLQTAAPLQQTPAQQALSRGLAELSAAVEGTRNDTLNKVAFVNGVLVGKGRLDREAAYAALERAALSTGLGEKEVRATLKSGLGDGIREGERTKSGNGKAMAVSAPKEDYQPAFPKGNLTDIANGRRLARHFGDTLRYVKDWGWMVWDGALWRRDDICMVDKCAESTSFLIYEEAAKAENKDASSRLGNWAKASMFGTRLRHMIRQARKHVAERSSAFDADHHLLNLENGVLDLRAGELLPHDPKLLMTKLAGTSYDPQAACPRWMAFLEEVLGGDGELMGLVQRAVGYALCGDASEQVIFFLYGTGANGKSTFLRVLQYLMGDYARQAAPNLLVKGDRHTTELADLAGARLVVSTELEPGRRLDMARLKQITGGDKMKGRFMRQDNFEFEVTFVIFLAGNTKPPIKETDHGTWRRFQMIPFTVTIPKERRDKRLVEKLREELPGILNWALAGYRDWAENGLGEAAAVEAAVAAYREEEDFLAAFFDERCVAAPDGETRAAELYAVFREWCEEYGERPWKRKTFTSAMRERGYYQERKKKGMYWQGIGLSAPEGVKGEI